MPLRSAFFVSMTPIVKNTAKCNPVSPQSKFIYIPFAVGVAVRCRPHRGALATPMLFPASKSPCVFSRKISQKLAQICSLCFSGYLPELACKIATGGCILRHIASFTSAGAAPSICSKQHSVYDRPFSRTALSSAASISASFVVALSFRLS